MGGVDLFEEGQAEHDPFALFVDAVADDAADDAADDVDQHDGDDQAD